jgi:hypothetical protein
MRNAILIITDGIITSAGAFAKNIAVFDVSKVPTVAWGKGVGAAIGAFAPVFKALNTDTGWFTSGGEVIQNMYKAITYITSAIIHSGSKFNKTNIKWTNYPTKEWASGVSSALRGFAPVFRALKDDEISSNIGLLYKGVTYMTNAIVYSARKFSRVSSWESPPPNYMKNLSKNMIDYVNLAKYISENENISIKNLIKGDPMENLAKGMVKLAKGYDTLAKSISKFVGAINNIDVDKLNALRNASRSKIIPNINSIESKGGPKWLEKKQSTGTKSDININKKSQQQNMASKKRLEKKLDEIVKVLKRIDKSATSLNDILGDMSSGNMSGTSDVG